MSIIRVNFDTVEDGEEYGVRLAQESEANFQVLLSLLSSYWQSTIDGPNYARSLKAVAIAMAKLRLSTEDVRSDTFFSETRSAFLYQTLTQILFPDGQPETGFGDHDFKEFLQKVIAVYFKGSVSESMLEIATLFANGAQVIVHENYEESRNATSGVDISDQFGFVIDVMLPSPGYLDPFISSAGTKVLLDIIRPAHTLFKLKHILSDAYIGQQTQSDQSKILDTLKFTMSSYNYEDFRKFVSGVDRLDVLGTKRSKSVTLEDHTMDF